MKQRLAWADLYIAATRDGEACGPVDEGVTALVRVKGGRRQVILGRYERPLSTIETITLTATGNIPDDAQATCYYPTNQGYWRIEYRWEVAAVAPASLFDQAPAPRPEPPPAPARGHVWGLLETGEPLPESLLRR